MKRVLVGMLFSLAVAAAPAAQMKYGVTAKADKNVDFTKLKSYSWSVGQPNPTKSIDALIVAAVDCELKALGLSKAEPGPGDVLVSYYAFRRTDVGMKPKSETGAPAQTAVGTLSVVLLDPKSKKETPADASGQADRYGSSAGRSGHQHGGHRTLRKVPHT